jgi:hypothetical protein
MINKAGLAQVTTKRHQLRRCSTWRWPHGHGGSDGELNSSS